MTWRARAISGRPYSLDLTNIGDIGPAIKQMAAQQGAADKVEKARAEAARREVGRCMLTLG
jgi:hypothetical protein